MKKKLLFFLSLFYIIALYVFLKPINFNDIYSAFINNSKAIYALVLVSFILNFVILSLRLRLSYRAFGFHISTLDAMRASFLGQIGNLFFLSFFGNMAGQTLGLKHKTIPTSMKVFVPFMERVVMLISGLVLVLISSAFLFKDKFQDIMNDWYLLQGITFFTVLMFAMAGNLIFHKKYKHLKYISKLQIINVLILSFFSWAVISGTYAIFYYTLNSSHSIVELFQSGSIVSFISSLPISINGWGVREFVSVKVFSNFGFLPSEAILVSISIGLLALLCIPLVGVLLCFFRNLCIESKLKDTLYTQLPSQNFDKLIIKFLGNATAIFIFFNICFSYNEITLNANPTDVIALSGLLLFFYKIYKKELKIEFITLGTENVFILATLAFSLSLCIGFYNFGFVSWAFLNKFVGWFVLIGYAAMGILYRYFFQKQELKKIIHLMTLILCSVILFKIAVKFLVNFHLLNPRHIYSNFEGFAQNRNAFGYQLFVVIALFTCYHVEEFRDFTGRYKNILLSILYFGLILTSSRTVYVLLPFFIILQLVFRLISIRELGSILLYTALFLVVDQYFFKSINYLSHLSSNYFSGNHLNGNHFLYNFSYSGDSSDHERWYSILQGIKLWVENPFFGKGLGGLVFQEMELNQRTLVIHNTFIWLLADFGFIGSLPFLTYFFSVTKLCCLNAKNYFQKGIYLKPYESSLILLVVIFGAFSMVHEVFYQRIFWFAVGLLIAKSKSIGSAEEIRYRPILETCMCPS